MSETAIFNLQYLAMKESADAIKDNTSVTKQLRDINKNLVESTAILAKTLIDAFDNSIFYLIDAMESLGNHIGGLNNEFTGWMKGLQTDFQSEIETMRMENIRLFNKWQSVNQSKKNLSLAETFQNFVQKIKTGFQKLSSGGDSRFGDWIKTITKSQEGFGSGKGKFGQSFTAVVGLQFAKIGLQLYRVFSKPIRQVWNFTKQIGKQFGQMGKDVLRQQLLTAPMQAFWSGFLEPLAPIMDLFGAFGELLGMGLMPIVQVLLEVLMPFLPVFKQLGEILAVVMQALAPFIKMLGGKLLEAILILMVPLQALADLLGGKINFEQFLGQLLNFGAMVLDFLWRGLVGVAEAIGQFIIDVFLEIGSLGVAKTKTFG